MGRKRLKSLIVSSCCLSFSAVFAVTASAQEPAAAPKVAYNKVLGEVTAIDPAGKKLTVKSDSGSSADVELTEATSYMRVPPGEKDLSKAERIELKSISVGDRVYARSRKVEGQEQSPAVSVIVMSRAEITQHQEKSREAWQRRGLAGKVKVVDPAAKTITVSMQTPAGLRDVSIETTAKTGYRRYTPDSVRFSDAKPGSFDEIAVGNNVRVLGERNADGSKMTAEEIVSGSFRNLAGAIESVDAQAGELKLKDLSSKKTITVKINADTNLRKIPPQMAMMMARIRAGGEGAGAANNGAANGTAESGAPSSAAASNAEASQPKTESKSRAASEHSTSEQQTPEQAQAGPGSGGRQWGGPGGPGARRMDMNQFMERAPKVTLAELQPGDAIIVSSTDGSDASRVTAITVVAGVDPLFRAAASSRGPLGGQWNFDIGLPE